MGIYVNFQDVYNNCKGNHTALNVLLKNKSKQPTFWSPGNKNSGEHRGGTKMIRREISIMKASSLRTWVSWQHRQISHVQWEKRHTNGSRRSVHTTKTATEASEEIREEPSAIREDNNVKEIPSEEKIATKQHTLKSTQFYMQVPSSKEEEMTLTLLKCWSHSGPSFSLGYRISHVSKFKTTTKTTNNDNTRNDRPPLNVTVDNVSNTHRPLTPPPNNKCAKH